MNSNIINISVFGSSIRDDIDELSDIDVLVLVEDGGGTVPEDDVLMHFNHNAHKKISISWYGQKKLSEMFGSGHLFSWHIYNESKPIGDFAPLSHVMGQPKPYLTCIEDIKGLVDLLDSTMKAFERGTPSIIYELGLVYLAARNIAMSASWHLLTVCDFGRYSPFKIKQPKFPISKEQYEELMKCRMASQRGLLFYPNIDTTYAKEICGSLLSWSKEIETEVKDAIESA